MRTYHKIVTPPPPAGREKTLADIPGELLEAWGIKLFSLMNLTWDYIDTICDLCVAMRLQPTKPPVRLVRELKRNYDSFRSLYVHSGFQRKERRNGELIEENLSLDFKKLFYSLSNEVSKLGLADDHKSLVIAVQQALTLMDAVKVYARRCDREIAAMGVWVCDCCLVHTEFLKLYDIIPQFAGDCYQPDIEARRLTAGIIARRLAEMPVKKAPQGETPPLVIRKKQKHKSENMTDSIDSTGNTGGRLTQYLTGVVAYIIDTRRRMSRPPFLALESNIRNVVLKDVAAALSIMEGEGVLTAHQTLNEKAYSLNQHEK